jgi:hypothetical protein
MKITSKLIDHAEVLHRVMEGFVQAAQLMVESGLVPPDPLDVPELEYRLEPPGEEDWKLPNEAIKDGWLDCEDASFWRAGGLRATGQDRSARVIVVQTGPGKLHAVVQLADGSLSDPSKDLYMRQRARNR